MENGKEGQEMEWATLKWYRKYKDKTTEEVNLWQIKEEKDNSSDKSTQALQSGRRQ